MLALPSLRRQGHGACRSIVSLDRRCRQYGLRCGTCHFSAQEICHRRLGRRFAAHDAIDIIFGERLVLQQGFGNGNHLLPVLVNETSGVGKCLLCHVSNLFINEMRGFR